MEKEPKTHNKVKSKQILLVALTFLLVSHLHGQVRATLSLNEDWKITSLSAEEALATDKLLAEKERQWYRGNMPAQVQEFILAAGELPDPSVQDNAEKWVPVFEKDWVYIKEFTSPDHTGNIELCFDGLDTEVDVFLNGKELAYCNNMNRRWRIPVNGKINPPGEKNRLVLRFYQPRNVIQKFEALYPDAESPSRKFIRKCDTDFKSYMGARPHFMKVGIFDNVSLDLLPDLYFRDVQVQSLLSADYSSAEIQVDAGFQDTDGRSIRYTVCDPDRVEVLRGKASGGSFSFSMEDPQLWYPMNYGEQPIYTLELELNERRKLLDRTSVQFGIRDLKIIQEDEATGNPLFCIQVNGKKIFMNGACWAPLHGFTHTWNEARADTLLHLMKLGNMNFLRIWGEGTIPGKSLFEYCDRNGILVMMDFMTCHPLEHPINDKGYRENFTLEIEDLIKRIRNHPSLAFWDGGNEHYLFHPANLGDNTLPVGRALFQKIMPDAVERLDPLRYFHPSSPWGGDDWFNGNDPLEGDFHDYSTVRFQPLSSVPLFTTEVCMVSPYAAHNMRRFMSEEEFWPGDFSFAIDYPGKKAWPAGWEHHSIGSAWAKIGRIQDYCAIQNAEDACRVFGMAHGQYLKERYERQRRGVPDGGIDTYRRSWGAAIWRLNDTWPMIYMSVVDYYLEPKIPYYFLKRACDPLLISFEQTDDRICVWVVNDTPVPVKDSLVVELLSFSGEVIRRCSAAVELGPSGAKRVIDLTHEFYEIEKRRQFLSARLGNTSKSHLMMPEKDVSLEEGRLSATLEGSILTLEADRYITSVEVSIPGTSGAIFSDNYFELLPGQQKTLEILEKKKGAQLKVKGLNSNAVLLEL